MNLSALIDVALGLSLVFFIFASIGSLLAELWAAHRKVRHRLLQQTVTRLLEPAAARKFWSHSLIQPLSASVPRATKGNAIAAPAEPQAASTAANVDATANAGSGQAARTKGRTARLWKHAVDLLVRKPWRMLRWAKPREADAPAYLDSRLFAAAVLDIASGQGRAGRVPDTLSAWEYAVRTYVPAKKGEHNDLQDRLLAILRQIPANTADVAGALKAAVARWYEEAMQRASGVYRRQTQKALLVIGCLLAVALNVDAVRVAYILYQNPELRRSIADQAEKIQVQLPPTDDQQPAGGDPHATEQIRAELKNYTGELRDLVKVGFPLGWMPDWKENFIRVPAPAAVVAATASSGAAAGSEPAATDASTGGPKAGFWREFTAPGWIAFFAKFCGLVASALAVCLGAPFWFDVLGRLVKLRSSAGADAEKAKSTATAPADGAAAAGVPAAGAAPAGTAAVAAATASVVPFPAAVDALGSAATAFDAARAYWLAEFASHAYEPDDTPADLSAADRRKYWKDSLRAWLASQGFTLVDTFDAKAEKVDTQGFIAVSASAAVLAFRGTEKKLADWVTDANFGTDKGADIGVTGSVHAGFARALQAAAASIDPLLDDLRKRRVLLHATGHSLGAALATLAALRCELRPATAGLVHSIHTYGSPRVGNPEFVATFESRFRGRAYRVVNNEDLVTRVPTREMGYDHVGEMIFIDTAGRLQRDIGHWYRFLNFVTNALGDLKEAVKTTVKDHSMQFYCGFLRKAAQVSRPSNP